jgi:predicted MPP superfamily phosphohydrolase
MPSYRFLPDLLLQVLALAGGRALFTFVGRSRLLRAVVAAGSALLIAGLVLTFLESLEFENAFRWMMISGLSVTWSGVVLSALAIAFIWKRIAPPENPERRMLLALAAPAVVLGYGVFIGRREFRLHEVDMALPGLPADLDGLRLVQLSDIHLSAYLSRAELSRCVDMANETRAHLAFVTGDLITGMRDPVDECLDELKRLRTDAGVFGCMGNHERYIQGEAYVEEHADQRGMKFLRQRSESLQFGQARLNIAGVDYQTKGRGYLRQAKDLMREGELNLLMSHNPDVFPVAAKQGWDLTLAGHMHGGQINLEIAQQNLNLARLSTPYVYGTYREGKSAIYVTRGIGTVAMPVRLGAPPEVALIRLRRV